MDRDPNTKPITIADIANASGYGKATVSRALSNALGVHPETRLNIQKVAQELGFSPNPVFKTLNTIRWSNTENRTHYKIGLLHLGPKGVIDPENSSHGLLLKMIRKEAEKSGYFFSTFERHRYHNIQALEKHIYQEGVDGIIIGTPSRSEKEIFDFSNYSVVFLGEEPFKQPVQSIVGDWMNAMILCNEKALSSGYQKIGITYLPRQNTFIDNQVRAAIAISQQNNKAMKLKTIPVFDYRSSDWNSQNYENTRPRFEQWLHKHKPDVIIDTSTIAYWYLKDINISYPDEIGLIHCLKSSKNYYTDISAADHRQNIQAQWAIKLLSQQIISGIKGIPDYPLRCTVPPIWFQGKSSRNEK